MPYLHDDEFDALNKTISDAKNELEIASRSANDSRIELSRVKLDLEQTKENLKVVTLDKEQLVTAKNELEGEINESINGKEDDLNELKKSAKMQNIILGCIAGIALALAYYFYSNGSSNNNQININEIKQLEATRVLDSINSLATSSNNASNTNNASLKDNIESLKNSLNGETIYSVQVGAFNKNSYSLLSETIAGLSSSNEGLFKYSLGLFKTLKEAQDFRRELVRLGFRDAFVASYIDGVRQEIQHPNK